MISIMSVQLDFVNLFHRLGKNSEYRIVDM